jgi:hypothetical protein
MFNELSSNVFQLINDIRMDYSAFLSKFDKGNIISYIDIQLILTDLSNRVICSDPFLWSESMYLTIYECVNKEEMDNLLNMRSNIHSANSDDLLCLFVEGEFENAEHAVAEIIKSNYKILSENYTVGAIFVVPKNKKAGIVVYLSK